jgi:hypothetical protein
MDVILEIHLVLAFLAALCAVVFSWNALGRRVVGAVVGLQFLVGLVAAGVMGASHMTLPPQVWLHLVIAILVLAAYGMASGASRRAGGANRALLLSIVGLVLLFLNIWIGLHMAGKV